MVSVYGLYGEEALDVEAASRGVRALFVEFEGKKSRLSLKGVCVFEGS